MPPPSPSLSFKNGDGLQPRLQTVIKPHPPRLQHSPSLPNIWFPPHSGPIPPKLIRMSFDNDHLLLDSEYSKKHEAPPQPSDKKQSEKPNVVPFREKPLTNRPHVKINAQNTPSRRHRIDNEPHKLLTPPLTPSSSIRTTTSVDSSLGHGDNFAVVLSTEVAGRDDDLCPSRFLRVDNFSPDVPQKVVQNAISSLITTPQLARYRPDTKFPAPTTSFNKDDIAQTNRRKSFLENPIKGLLLRSGFVFLAFHDLRDAIAAKTYFETRQSDVFDSCVDQATNEIGRKRLTGTFLTMDQVTIELGESTFLESMDASFQLTVEPDVPLEDVSINLTKRTYNEDVETKKSVRIATREIVLLRTFLESFGDIRSFSDTTPDNEGRASNSECKTFRVEFFDIRETTSAYEALDGMAMFGMRIKVSGRENLESIENTKSTADHEDSDVIQAEKTTIVPFPISRASDDCIQPFGPPGQLSQTRQLFSLSLPVDGLSNDDTPLTAFSDPSENRGSPPVFYTSETHVVNGTQVGINGKTPDERNTLDPQHQLVQSYYGFAYPALDRAANQTPLIPYFASTPTPPPLAFHSGYLSPPPPPRFLGPGPINTFSGGIPLERDPYAMQHINMAWPIEMNGIPAYPSGFPRNANAPPPQDPYWLQGATPTGFSGSTASYFSPGVPCLPGRPPNDESSAPPSSSAPEGSPCSNDSPSPSHNVKTSLTSTSKKETSEHNQLNLVKIETGVDTRTTIMIKNIPNKMTDKDLMHYIAKVCPRRIDFLYLRMDFKNGCNVGYAFVNFISVEDLVLFAKSRLGQKWNMFSSEKVLQMSYANYQGKEALVEKFKNSCIMDEREAWRPKIFYSDPGPEQGLPEPFPSATHQRRKERSSHNRGDLFVPGNCSLPTQNLLNAPFGPRRFDSSPHRRERERNHRRQRTTTTRE
ncbi:RNA recognition motif 2-domain-containing protein [Lentinula edodes]|uniref:RNA recognition motif 2-domain-containing protein n=1 Tax=Lentinula edodes TaxID=5353 RepID=UPI001E8ED7C8|nr:RNA recognition motif 2-domain-containing protein [Lentinula edodes]KAH7874718.1 RNA recognition motif 2-domain-containing protein [Lentinula edodes]